MPTWHQRCVRGRTTADLPTRGRLVRLYLKWLGFERSRKKLGAKEFAVKLGALRKAYLEVEKKGGKQKVLDEVKRSFGKKWSRARPILSAVQVKDVLGSVVANLRTEQGTLYTKDHQRLNEGPEVLMVLKKKICTSKDELEAFTRIVKKHSCYDEDANADQKAVAQHSSGNGKWLEAAKDISELIAAMRGN
ncbi:unnamed protein product, partial [Mesorhabditis spiculigera]